VVVTGGPNSEEDFEAHGRAAAVVRIQSGGFCIKRDLATNSHVDSGAMLEVMDIAESVGPKVEAERIQCGVHEDQLVPGLLDLLEPRVPGIGAALIVGLEKERIERAAVSLSIFAPDEGVGPV